MSPGVEIVPVRGLPEIATGERLGELIAAALASAGEELSAVDVVAVSQKVVSKAEGRVRDLGDVVPGARARELATGLGKDPRLVELILSESQAGGPRRARCADRRDAERLDLRQRRHRRLERARHRSRHPAARGPRRLGAADPSGDRCGVRGAHRRSSIADSFGRPWRLGQADVAIGCAGLAPLDDWRGRTDRQGRELTATVIAIADEVAAAADLARGKDAGVPACLVRGLGRFVSAEDGPGARAIQRPEAEDLFR